MTGDEGRVQPDIFLCGGAKPNPGPDLCGRHEAMVPRLSQRHDVAVITCQGHTETAEASWNVIG